MENQEELLEALVAILSDISGHLAQANQTMALQLELDSIKMITPEAENVASKTLRKARSILTEYDITFE